jgi:hypothetical protein
MVAHEPSSDRPIFFSVTRNSVGEPGSAVRSQLVIQGGAAGDVFVMAKIPDTPPGTGFTNLLFIDDLELGLRSDGMADGVPGPDDLGDDLDGLILNVCPEGRPLVAATIHSILSSLPIAYGPNGERVVDGMTNSITKKLGAHLPEGCVQVGYSDTTDAVGQEFTAVDYEAGGLDPGGGNSSAAGDVFYAVVTGAVANPNYLWYEAEDLALDPGTWNWVGGTPADLSRLSDNLDGLDSVDSTGVTVGVREPSPSPVFSGVVRIAAPAPNPVRAGARFTCWTAREGDVRVTVHDVQGRALATVASGRRAAGLHFLDWDGRAADGTRLDAGVYLVRAQVDGGTSSAKFVVLN